jgi:hypothetical protein
VLRFKTATVEYFLDHTLENLLLARSQRFRVVLMVLENGQERYHRTGLEQPAPMRLVDAHL